ncbi:MAG: hypothetical protein JWP14_2666 [Frankiales bacterium]|nr:hypothetical protein [Frankiales bacterium]
MLAWPCEGLSHVNNAVEAEDDDDANAANPSRDTKTVATLRQTSVRVPHEAVAALQIHATRLGVSRDAALREAIADFVERQQPLNEEARLTHLTTVLRYPPMPLGRGTPDPRAHLRFRIDPEQREAASELGLRLPGQSGRHGHHHYAARPLTDAVMTATYEAEPFVVSGLEGLPQVLTRRVADGLWRLTVAATLTAAETQALWRSGGSDLPVVLTEEEVAWHHPWRFAVAHRILKTLLLDDDAAEWMDMLESQTGQYRSLLAELQRRDPAAGWLQDGLRGLDTHRSSVEGRGGTAVWRADRELEMTRITAWLADPESTSTLSLETPEWSLRWPDEWTKACLSLGAPIPPELDAAVASGKVSVVTSGSRLVFWPLTAGGHPVEQFAACLHAGQDLAPARLAEVVLLDHEELPTPRLPAATAHDFGLITEEERDDLVATAAASNASMIASTMRRAAERLDADELAELSAVVDQPRRFVTVANRHHLHCWYYNDWWLWPMRSVVDGIRGGHSSARIGALTEAFISITTRELEMAMTNAWHRAFWLGRAAPDKV